MAGRGRLGRRHSLRCRWVSPGYAHTHKDGRASGSPTMPTMFRARGRSGGGTQKRAGGLISQALQHVKSVIPQRHLQPRLNFGVASLELASRKRRHVANCHTQQATNKSAQEAGLNRYVGGAQAVHEHSRRCGWTSEGLGRLSCAITREIVPLQRSRCQGQGWRTSTGFQTRGRADSVLVNPKGILQLSKDLRERFIDILLAFEANPQTPFGWSHTVVLRPRRN